MEMIAQIGDPTTLGVADAYVTQSFMPELTSVLDEVAKITDDKLREAQLANEQKLALNQEYLNRIDLLERVLLQLNVSDSLADVQKIKAQYLITGTLSKDSMILMNDLYAKYYKELRRHPDAATVFADIANKLNPLKGK
jgi:hypothetical protein